MTLNNPRGLVKMELVIHYLSVIRSGCITLDREMKWWCIIFIQRQPLLLSTTILLKEGFNELRKRCQ